MISSSSASDGRSPVAQGRPDPLRQLGVDQRGGRQVHRDAEHASGVAPAAHLVQRLLEHGVGEVAHQAGVLDQRQERVGQQQAAGRVLPAHQGLDAGDRERAARRPSAGSARRASGRRSPSAAPRGCAGGAGRAASRWPACRRSSRSGVALAWYIAMSARRSRRRDLVAVLREQRDADAGVDPHGDAVHGERGLEHVADAAGADAPRHRPSASERTARRTRRRPGGPARRWSPCRFLRSRVGDQPQQVVAGVVPEAVVDLLEPVEVEQQQRARVRRRRRAAAAALS